MKKCIKSISSRIRKLSVLILLMGGFLTMQINAQQSAPPFTLDLNLGGGLIGNPNVNTAFQPELGFSYIPGKWGVGLNTGFLSYNTSFDADNYTEGFEDFTSVASSKEKWSSFFIGAGPRFEFGSRLPVKLKGGLDLSFTYNSPPDISVAFDDADNNMPGVDLKLSELNSGDNYNKWSAALRPQFQIQFSPGNSDRFGINITTGLQHRLSNNQFTYSQRDLSDVQSVDNVREMFFQFEAAPEVQRTERPAKTNFFANVGVIIKIGRSKTPDVSQPLFTGNQESAAQDYNSSRSNKPNTRANDTSDDCDDSGPCQHPGDAVELAQDYNSSRSNKPNTRANDTSDDCDDNEPCQHPGDAVELAQDYNSSRSNKPTSRAADIGDGDPDSDGDGIDDAIETAQDYNSSRSNKPRTETPVDDRDGNSEIVHNATVLARIVNPAGTIISAGQVLTSSNPGNPLYDGESVSGENPLYEGQANDGDSGDNNYGDPVSVQGFHLQPSSYCVDLSSDSQQGMRADAQNHNSSRSNKTEGVSSPDLGDTSDTDSEADARAIPPSIAGLEVTAPTNLKPDTDQDGFPEIMKGASFSISKRSARTGLNQSPIHKENTVEGQSALYEPKEELANNDGDGYGATEGFHFELEINDPDSEAAGRVPARDSSASDNNSVERDNNANAPPGSQLAPSQTKVIDMGITDNGDIPPLEETKQTDVGLNVDSDADGIPDFRDTDSDGDGLMDALESATYSISKRSARTGRGAELGGKEIETMESMEGTASSRESQANPLAQESGWQDTPQLETAHPNNVYQWTYKLSSMAGSEEFPVEGTLTILFTGSAWHFDVQPDPDDDGDGYGELFQNSSFSISKRSARTGGF